MNVKVYDLKGKETGTATLNKDVFARGERRGSTRKLFRQKGTGRARAGSARSPIRIGGGVVFGPRNNRNFTLAMNKKERQKALMCMLSNKAKSKAIVVVKDLKLKEIKTQIMDAALKSLPVTGKVLVALHEKNENASKSTSNLKYAKSIDMNYLNIADLLKYEILWDSIKYL